MRLRRKKATDESEGTDVPDELPSPEHPEISEPELSETGEKPKLSKRKLRKRAREEMGDVEPDENLEVPEDTSNGDEPVEDASIGEKPVEDASPDDDEPEEPELPKGIKKLRKRHYRETSHDEDYIEDAPKLPSGVRELRRRHFDESPTGSPTARRLRGSWEGSWIQANWKPIAILLMIFFFAFFVRAYYGVTPATEDGFILSGGSDSYYHNYVIDNTLATGDHYFADSMINYPIGTRNPRPPLYDWGVNMGGIALTPFFGGDVITSTWYMFLFSTALWGALTIFPVYLLAKDAFGREAGYMAAFLLAIMPGHIQRSVLTNADHDAFALFFIVTSFYFFFRALRTLKDKSWVENWRSPKKVKDGLFGMMGANMDSIIYGLLAGVSLAAVALTWKGYAYVIVIMTAYFLIQLLIDRFRNSDSIEVVMVYFVTVGSAFLLIFPYYYQSIQIAGWFDTPVIMFLAAVTIGAVLVITRKLPWILVISSFILLAFLGVLILAIVSPALLDSIFGAVASGAGYFVQNKQYQTIAEAQAPPFSNLALSFGVLTFWLSFVGVAWAMYQLPKNMKFDYIFVTIWAAASIYMATSAARFMFNAAPVFAITAGWIVAIIVDKLNFKEFVAQQKRMVQLKLTRNFTLGLIGATALLIIVAAGLSSVSDLAMPVFVIGLAAIVSTVLMNLIAETNPNRLYSLLALLVPVGGAGFYIFMIFSKEWELTNSTHGFVLLFMLLVDFLLYLTVKRTKISFTVGVLFLAFWVITPNVWAGLDAGIPYEIKLEHDKEVYQVMPVFLRPDTYDAQNGSNWYFGGFGYSLPLNSKSYPACYDWLATQDADVYPPKNRPAYLSWWDYGFEAVNEGKHPTVADNFLGGHQLAGNFIMSQSEEQAISLLTVRILESDWLGDELSVVRGEFTDNVADILASYGLDVDEMENIYNNPLEYIETIKANPDIYGPRDDVIQNANARYLAARGMMTENLDLQEITSLYHDIREETGHSIRYFAIDSRMFPFSAQNTGIFYAPAKLSDHRIDDNANMPYDFFEIKAVGEFGGEYPIDDIPSDVMLDPDNPYKIVYKDMFYNSMLYKAYIGYSAADIGGNNSETGGIPVISEGMDQNQIMPGWNMSHFKLVHKTVYWNPYSAREVRNHTDEWRAMNFWEAKERMDNGDGIADLSDRSSISQRTIILKYYDGAIISGRVTLEDDTPVGGVRLTVLDDFDIPHQTVLTDSEGFYSIIAPFGDIKLTASTGEPNPLYLVGTPFNQSEMFIEDYQAMREKIDADGDGHWDYLIDHDIVIQSGELKGLVYWDMNGDDSYSPVKDVIIEDATVTISSKNFTITRTGKSNVSGEVEFKILPPDNYEVVIRYADRDMHSLIVSVTSDTITDLEWGVQPTSLKGVVMDENNEAAENASINIWIEGEKPLTTYVTENGNFTFENLLYGVYLIQAIGNGTSSVIESEEILHLQNNTVTLTMEPTYVLSGTLTMPNYQPLAGAFIRLTKNGDSGREELFITDAEGSFLHHVKGGKYTVYATYPTDGNDYMVLTSIEIDDDLELDFEAEIGYAIQGDVTVPNLNYEPARNAEISFKDKSTLAEITGVSDDDGRYSIQIPSGTYDVYSTYQPGNVYLHYSTVAVDSDAVLELEMEPAIVANHFVFYDKNLNNEMDSGEELENAAITYEMDSGEVITSRTDSNGRSETALYSNTGYDVLINRDGFRELRKGRQSSDTLTSETATDPLIPIETTVKGNILLDGELLLDENAFVEFQNVEVENQTQSIQMSRDGTYSTVLRPGSYLINLEKNVSLDNDSLIYQIDDLMWLEIGYFDGSEFNMDIPVVERIKVDTDINREDQLSAANLTLIGPETREFSIENGNDPIYLIPGEYVARISHASADMLYLANVRVNVSNVPMISANLEESFDLSGDLKYLTETIPNQAITITDTLTGDVIQKVTDSGGHYSANLVRGRNYNLDVSFTEIEDNGHDGKTAYFYYNRLSHQANETIDTGLGNELSHSIALERMEYFIWLNGTVNLGDVNTAIPDARLEFVSENDDKFETYADENGNYSISLPAGNMTVYVIDYALHNVYLDTILISLDDIEADFSLVPGFKLSGTVYFNLNQHQETNLTFNSAKGTVNTMTDENGYYSIWLPPDTYDITGEMEYDEGGVEVDYSLSTQVVVDDDIRKNLPMTMEEIYEIDIEWRMVGGDRAITSGESAEYVFTIINKGNIPDTCDISGSTEPGWEFEFNRTRVSVDHGDANAQEVMCTITSPAEAKVQHNDIDIKAMSVKNPEISKTIKPTFEIKQVYGIGISTVMANTPNMDGNVLEFPFTVTNDGNGRDTYTIYIANAEELKQNGWDVEFMEPEVSGAVLSNDSTKITDFEFSGITELILNLEKNNNDPYSDIRVLIGASSQQESTVFISHYLDISYPRLILSESNITITGDIIVQDPSNDPSLGLSITIIAVGSGLMLFYLMKKKRWLR